ncbi:MAG: hypothetical protein A2081_02870, partial [Elusimicrobia bacterium GWC2_61_19]
MWDFKVLHYNHRDMIFRRKDPRRRNAYSVFSGLAARLLLIAAVSHSLPPCLRAQTELGSEDDLTVLGATGTAIDPDTEIKGFTVFGATQTAYPGAVAGAGNVVVNGVLSVSSGAYFTGNSTFTEAGRVFILDGSEGQILSKNTNGYLQWTSSSALGDNLGSHIATTTLNMATFNIVNVGAITANAAITTYSSMTVAGNLSVSTIVAAGNITAARYQINGSTVLATIPSGRSISVGMDAGRVNTANDNVFIGYQAGNGNTTGTNHVYIGYQAGFSGAAATQNTFVGQQAGMNNAASSNSFFGALAGRDNNTGTTNTFLGSGSGWKNTSGVNNVFTGSGSGSENLNGRDNVFTGVMAGGNNTSGNYNSIVGNYAAYATKTGSNNAVFGYYAGNGVSNNSYGNNSIFGYYAGSGLSTGSNNILVGYQSGDALTTGAGNILIGYDQDASAPTASNELNIGGVLFGNLSARTIGISTRAPQAALDIVSTGTAANIYAQIWRDGSGVIKASMTSEGTLYATLPSITGPGDNLGNHIATTTLNMNTFNIVNVASVTAHAAMTVYSSVTVTGAAAFAVASGSVGIGTNSPGARLEISNTNTGTGVLRLRNTSAVTGDVTGVDFHHASDGSGAPKAYIRDYLNSDYSTDLNFGTAMGTGNAATRMAIKANGNVGIGTVAPAYRLVVSSGAGEAGTMMTISTGTSDVIRMTGDGSVYANRFYGDGSGLTGISGDNLGNHIATTTLNMAGFNISGVSTVTAAGYVDAARYLINKSTIMAILPGYKSFAIGINAGILNGANADYNLFVGEQAGESNVTGDDNAFFGYKAGYLNTASDNTFIGYEVGYYNSSGFSNVFVGHQAGFSNETGSDNTFVGKYAGGNGFDGSHSSLFGSNAGYANSGDNNSFVGSSAGHDNTTGANNSILGYQAGSGNITGSANSIFGTQAGYGVSANSYSSSTLVGYKAGFAVTTGSDNLLLGFQAGDSLTTGSRNIIIGYDEDAPAATTNNFLNLGGVLYGDLSGKTIGISTRVPQAALDIVSTGTAHTEMAQIWRKSDGVIVGSMSATGVMT